MLGLNVLECELSAETHFRDRTDDIGKIIDFDPFVVAKDNGAFDDISQLTQVSRPGITAQGFDRCRRKGADGFAGVGG